MVRAYGAIMEICTNDPLIKIWELNSSQDEKWKTNQVRQLY